MSAAPAGAGELRRRYVTVGESRQVHYRRGGSGPPFVLMHESPLSSGALVELAGSLGDRFTVIALDTPGYGNSDALATPAEPETSDYAAAAADTLAALGVERCVVYGALTGATIALELARSRSDLVAGVALDFVPWFPAELRAWFLENYLPLFTPRDDGGHLLALWARFRDQYAYLPWCDRRLENRMDVEMPSTQMLHDGVMDMLRAGDGYRVAYAAAFRYEPEAPLADLSVPSVLIAPNDGLIAAQRECLASAPVGTATAPLPCGPEAEAMVRLLGDELGLEPADELPVAAAWNPLPNRQTSSYVDTSLGQLHVRGRPGSDARPLVMLHASPGSARMLNGLIERLMARSPVLAFDTLGNGESDKPPGWERATCWEPTGAQTPVGPTPPPPWDEPSIADYGALMAEAIDALALDEVDIYGSHTGGSIAIETAIALGSERARNVIVDGLAIFTSEERDDLLANYTPPLDPHWDGSHLAWAWSFLQAQLRFWPWYNQTREGIRWVEEPPADSLHEWVVELLKSGHTYPLAYNAAFAYPALERLPLLASRTLIGADADDMLAECSEVGARLAPNATAVTLPIDVDERSALFARFLDDDARD